MTPDRVSISAKVPRVSIHGITAAHRAAFHGMTPEQRDEMTAPLRDALEAVNAQTAPLRATLAGLAEQAERMHRVMAPTISRHAETLTKCGELLRIGLEAAEKADAVERAVIDATPVDRRPHVRNALRVLRRSGLTPSDADEALAAVHDFLTADVFGRLYPEGRAWGLAWAFARLIRGEKVDALEAVARDREPLREPEPQTEPPRRTYGERRERYRRRPAPVLSNRLAAHAPPVTGAHRGGTPTHLDRKEKATA